ncbi:MAG: hypothetical protein JWN67_4034 [Actinomycetia bacterium]|nr:hypothetical protein [Actinomycetes bacterium]
MGIPSVTEISHRTPAPMPVPPVASGVPASAAQEEKKGTPQPVHVAPAAPPPPPPPPPSKGFNMDVEVGFHEETNTKIYNFVDPDSGDTVVQIPVQNVLNLVASILRRMEAEGQR